MDLIDKIKGVQPRISGDDFGRPDLISLIKGVKPPAAEDSAKEPAEETEGTTAEAPRKRPRKPPKPPETPEEQHRRLEALARKTAPRAARKYLVQPKCCGQEDWRAWIFYARMARPGPGGFCEDCTPEFQSRMVGCGRCSHPEIRFVVHRGELIGAPPPKTPRPAKKKVRKGVDSGERPGL